MSKGRKGFTRREPQIRAKQYLFCEGRKPLWANILDDVLVSEYSQNHTDFLYRVNDCLCR